jgi:hypothetical protein
MARECWKPGHGQRQRQRLHLVWTWLLLRWLNIGLCDEAAIDGWLMIGGNDWCAVCLLVQAAGQWGCVGDEAR